jgi:hypothetical protein
MQEKETATSYAIGDPVTVSDAEGEYLGVIVALGRELHVQMIVKRPDGLYQITCETNCVCEPEITAHVHLTCDDDAPRAYDSLGYRMIDGDTFSKHTDEARTMAPIGDARYEIYSSDDDGESMDDFIVPDDECEPFTNAPEDNEFVRTTHAAVRQFNAWVPENDAERNARGFILRQQARAVRVDDDARFARNMPGATTYENPS